MILLYYNTQNFLLHRITHELKDRLNAYAASKDVFAGWIIRNLLNKHLPKNISNNNNTAKKLERKNFYFFYFKCLKKAFPML